MSNRRPHSIVRPPSEDAFVLSDAYRADVRARAYISKKGYTIPKSVLHPDDLKTLYRELTMVPVKHGAGASYGAGGDDDDAFPVYRENANKIYLPRFYGIERYGGYPDAPTPEQPRPSPIHCPFEKPLRDYQEKVVETYLNHVHVDVDKPRVHDESKGGILTLGCGMGKCMAKDTAILMYDGTVKAVQDVVVGDQLMGDDSTPRNVLTLARGRETMYRVHDIHGEGYTVNASHILSLKYGSPLQLNRVVDVPVLEYLKRVEMCRYRAVGALYGYRVPVSFPAIEVEVDPYWMGIWIGGGGTPPSFVRHRRRLHDESASYHTDSETETETDNDDSDQEMNDWLHRQRQDPNRVPTYIPYVYKCNSHENRLALLAGILDSAGVYHHQHYCYKISYERTVPPGSVSSDERNVILLRLIKNTMYLARSLGMAAVRLHSDQMIMILYGTGLDDIPVRCHTMDGYDRRPRWDSLKYSIRLEKLPEDDYYGFEIDGNRRFLLGDFTVTHNTVISIKIISALALKTLIVVHKEFLMNQWIERLQEFLPSARIGKIQGPVFDSAGKDVVIGMLQTLYDRDFPDKAFDDFGLLVFDEVHRSASSQFSRALLRIQPPYMLGVTATLERKDGLTKLIHMFMGPVVYAQTQSDRALPADMTVVVRAMTFTTQDSDFNHVVTDFRGNPQFSTMISKLCAYNRRTQFIVNVLEDLVAETPDAQILVLGHNRCLLTDVFAAVAHRGFAEPGMYVGGMKQADLDVSSKKQVVVSTFSMSSEALDIPTLQILVMMTPKTDIVQVVGRIFRAKHTQKIIVDIVDRHDVFQNQWRKRRAYYKKCGYMIQTADSAQYARDFADPAVWTTVHDPARPGRGGRGKKTAAKDSDSDNEEGSDTRNCMIPFVDDGIEP
jgi:superfamily II DNA or RNA helicase